MAGDEVLKRVCQALTDYARVSDFIACYGGEEFAAILLHTSRLKAQVATERMFEEISRVHWKGKQVTVSAGVSTYAGLDALIDTLIEEAGSALYAAKAAGRNQVILAS
jgi:diguanylate cyclase (GGDEF)-like protein